MKLWDVCEEAPSMKLWDVCELAEQLGVPPSWVSERARKKQIPHLKLGRYVRFDPADPAFAAWLASQRVTDYDPTRLNENDGPYQEDHMARFNSTHQKGTIRWRKRKTGKVALLRYRLRENNKWVEKTETLEGCTTKGEARHAADKRMTEINRLNNSHRLTLAQFVGDLWQQYLRHRNIKPSTAHSYDSMMKTTILPALGQKYLDQVTPQNIAECLGQRKEKRSSKYVLNLYGLLNVLFEVAQHYDLITVSPVRRKLHRPASERKEKPVLSSKQIRMIIEAVPAEYRTLFVCLALTGLRRGELLGLRWEDIDFDGCRLNVTHSLWRGRLVPPKTAASRRSLHLPQTLEGLLRAHKKLTLWDSPADFVFARADGTPHDPDWLREGVLHRAMRSIGITPEKRTHGFHLFRHTAASILYAVTRDMKLGQGLLGHSQMSTTANIYTHLDATEAARATETLSAEIMGVVEIVVKDENQVN